MKKIMVLTVLLAFILVIMCSTPVQAHRMIVEVIEDGVVQVRYDDGTAAGRASVSLFDEDGVVLEEGSADEDGIYFYNLKITPHRIVADDGMGHRARWVEGQVDAWSHFPRWQRAMLGVAVLLFIAAFTYYRRKK